ncbi:MAG: hypothetical protein JKX73_01220 [Flavobacteriales bacterium]|nr:hypothetical protein [Flavobacteriales bacterium]
MIEDFCGELNKYLQVNYSYKRPPAYANGNSTIDARRSKFDLYFRFKPENENKLVIARMGFKEQKKGHGTRLLKFISAISKKYEIKYISIESVNKNSFEFGKKIGFSDLGNGNMKITSEDLIFNLKNK